MWLKIEADLNSRYKVSWCGAGFFYWYYVGTQTIAEAADRVRTELEKLSSWGRTRDPATRRKRLVALAKAGASLRYRLFLDWERMPEIHNLEQSIAEEYQRGDRELWIQADSSIHVPWGLAYDGDEDEIDEQQPAGAPASEIEEFAHFWCLKYRLSAMASGRSRPRSEMTRPRNTFGLLSLINSDVEEQIKHDFEQQQEVYLRFCDLLSQPLGRTYDVRECRKRIEAAPQSDILFHFLGHHDGQVLHLGGGQTVDYDRFSRLVDSMTGRTQTQRSTSCALLFLNGCESAPGEKDYSLRALADRTELGGAIATESKVRRKYAAEFGVRFLEAMVNEGKSVADAMYELHHDAALWPESLLYGCYANPHYRIEQPGVAVAAPAG